jgi:ubiquinone biosynthesis protein COQ4
MTKTVAIHTMKKSARLLACHISSSSSSSGAATRTFDPKRTSPRLLATTNQHQVQFISSYSPHSDPLISSSTTAIPFYGLPQKRRSPQHQSFLYSVPNVNNILEQFHHHPIRKFVEQSVIAMKDPTRADAVAAVGELTGRYQLQQLLHRMQCHPIGREILFHRPIVSKTTLPYHELITQAQHIQEQHERLHEGSNSSTTGTSVISDENLTFGQAYGLFLSGHGFDPDERDEVKYLDTNSNHATEQLLAYVMLRYRQCHDYWHTITKLPPTVGGEIGLKLLELFHMGMPVAALSCIASTLLRDLTAHERHVIWNSYLPWARRQAKNMALANVSLLNVYYEHEFHTPILELRQKLHIEPIE